MQDVAVDVSNVSKNYPNEAALDDVTVAVRDGEFIVVLGPSGCGKTTLLECIAGVHPPDTGSIAFFGEDVTETPVEDRNVGYVFQDFEETLFPHLTAEENVRFAARHADRDVTADELDREIDDLFELLSLSAVKDDPPNELSGGQQQRVELARQLVRGARILLFDDPLSDLDYKLEKRMRFEIRTLHREREATFVYVTHNQDQAFTFADRLVVMNDGVIEQIGAPDVVYESPANAFVARFVGNSNVLVGRNPEGDDVVTVATAVGEIRARSVGDPADSTNESIVTVRPENVSLGAEADGKDNTFDAVVSGLTYMGEATELSVRFAEADEEFVVIKPGELGAYEVGEKIQIGWDERDCAFFYTLSETSTVEIEDLLDI